jgi:hypothetical protein
MNALRRDSRACPPNCQPSLRFARSIARKVCKFSKLEGCKLSWRLVLTKLAKSVVYEGAGKNGEYIVKIIV